MRRLMMVFECDYCHKRKVRDESPRGWHETEHNGVTYNFCCEKCLKKGLTEKGPGRVF